MYKRYLPIVSVLIALIVCFFLFFDKPTKKETYNKYFNKIESVENFDNIKDNSKINIEIRDDYLNNRYSYVITFTSNETLTNFKAMVIANPYNETSYYPSFGIIDNEGIDLVNGKVSEKTSQGVNLVVTSLDKIETFKVYVSYDNQEYYYFMGV